MRLINSLEMLENCDVCVSSVVVSLRYAVYEETSHISLQMLAAGSVLCLFAENGWSTAC